MRKAFRSRPYRAWIARQPCLRCGHGPCQAAHVDLGRRGVGLKAPDTHCVPLCGLCHPLEHQLGVESFWGNVNVKMEIIKLITWYLIERGVK